ncbi:MAG TPA: hypothetical protein VGF26_20620, partial [Ramlibacter sp.]
MIPAAGVPWRPLVAVTVVVLCAHLLALRGVPRHIAWRPLPPRLVIEVHAPPAVVPAEEPPQLAEAPGVGASPGAKSASGAPRVASKPTPPRTATSPVSLPAGATWRFTATGQWRGAPVTGAAVLAWQHAG